MGDAILRKAKAELESVTGFENVLSDEYADQFIRQLKASTEFLSSVDVVKVPQRNRTAMIEADYHFTEAVFAGKNAVDAVTGTMARGFGRDLTDLATLGDPKCRDSFRSRITGAVKQAGTKIRIDGGRVSVETMRTMRSILNTVPIPDRGDFKFFTNHPVQDVDGVPVVWVPDMDDSILLARPADVHVVVWENITAMCELGVDPNAGLTVVMSLRVDCRVTNPMHAIAAISAG